MTDALKMLQDRVYLKDKLAREMTHQPFVDPYHGVPENFAMGVYEAPGMMMEGFDLLKDYTSPLGWAVEEIWPTETHSASVVDELMNLGEMERAYTELGPYGATDALQGAARFAGQMIDPLAIGGATIDAAKAMRYAPEVLSEIAADAVISPISKQSGYIGGQRSRASDQAALERAIEMKQQNLDSRDIWDETGWWMDHPDNQLDFNDPEGRMIKDSVNLRGSEGAPWVRAPGPRFEIDDSQGVINWPKYDKRTYEEKGQRYYDINDPKASFEGRLGDLYDDPELYRHYPELADYQVIANRIPPMDLSRRPGGGFNTSARQIMFDFRAGDVDTNNEADPLRILKHEIQHAIQEIEGHSRGGSPQEFPTPFLNMDDLYSIRSEPRVPEPGVEAPVIDEYLENFDKKHGTDIQEMIEEQFMQTNLGDMEMSDWNDLVGEVDRQLKKKGVSDDTRLDFYHEAMAPLSRKLGSRVPMNMYRRLAGETEARLVENRNRLTPQERFDMPFWNEETPRPYNVDVPYREQIPLEPHEGYLDIPADMRSIPYSLEELQQVPMVAQSPLERAQPAKGKRPKSLDRLLGKRTETRMSEYAKRGDESGAGRAWYNLDPLREVFVDELGVMKGDEQFKRYTDFLAATSPREKVKQNVKRGSLFHYLERQGEPFAHLRNPGKVGDPTQEIPAGYGSLGHETQRHLLKDLEGGGHFSGLTRPKVSSFAENLSGNQWPITIDTHNIKALTGGKWSRSPTPAEYGYIENFEADIADKLGMTPAQFQASVWVGAGAETGVADVRPFIDVFNDVVVETAEKRGITPAEALKQFVRGEKPLLGLAAAITGGTIAVEQEDNDGDRS